MIIVIEGPDGCGKTTVGEALAKRLDCRLISFPDDSAFTGPAIRSYLRRRWSVSTSISAEKVFDPGPVVLQALMVANRMERMAEIREHERSGEDLVLVRYWQSAWVYGQLDGLPVDFLENVHADMVRPDVSILLDLDAEACLERRAKRDGARPPERYEGDLERTRRIVGLYRSLWDPQIMTAVWCPVVDASGSFESVCADVEDTVEVIRDLDEGRP